MSSQVVLLCGAGDSSAAVANALQREFGHVPVVVEGKEPRLRFLRRRLKRLGAMTVAGQIAFAALVPALRLISRARICQIQLDGALDLDRRALQDAWHVPSVNSPEVIRWLRKERPKVVVVNGTRIIARRVIGATDAVFVNTHCGITPEYRGSHGGYWALSRDDGHLCGVTVHLVDFGIDTGGILAQMRITPTPQDNFVTYPYLQLAAGIPLLLGVVRAALEGKVEPEMRPGCSKLWYHPTLWHYLATGLRRAVW